MATFIWHSIFCVWSFVYLHSDLSASWADSHGSSPCEILLRNFVFETTDLLVCNSPLFWALRQTTHHSFLCRERVPFVNQSTVSAIYNLLQDMVEQ
jgi:hypothetical protein